MLAFVAVVLLFTGIVAGVFRAQVSVNMEIITATLAAGATIKATQMVNTS